MLGWPVADTDVRLAGWQVLMLGWPVAGADVRLASGRY